MKAQTLAMAITLAGTANLVNAQQLSPASSYLEPVGWAATESTYATAAREFNNEFRNRTNKQPDFSPGEFNSRVGQSLDTRLSQKLRRQLTEERPEKEAQVSAN